MSTKMDAPIVFVSPYSHKGTFSGAQRRIEGLMTALGGLGLQSVCLSPWKPAAPGAHVPFSIEGPILDRFSALRRLAPILRDLRPGLVISEGPTTLFARGPWVLYHLIHDAKFATEHGRRGKRVTRAVHRLCAAASDRVLTVSESEKRRLTEHLGIGAGRVFVSYNGFGEMWLGPLPGAELEREFDILYVSNFAKHKGHRRLIAALEGSGFTLAFVGADFGERASCQILARQLGVNAVFFEKLDEDELIGLYDRSRVFAFPSRLEGFGIPYLEARARGLPVVAEDIEVFRELRSKLGGAIVDFEDRREALKLMQEARTHQRARPDIGEFAWRGIAERLVASAKEASTARRKARLP